MSIIPDVYQVLVVDDEPDIHTLTKLALKSLKYKGKDVEMVSANTAEEALEYLKENPDTAVVLMDVVMESDMAGLEACKRIRDELGNDNVRILLRTGQPGQAPEKKVIETYEIDGYLAKAELTNTRLFTAVRTALKAFTELKTVKWMENILTFLNQSSSALQALDSLSETLEDMLMISQEIAPSDLSVVCLNLEQEIDGKADYLQYSGRQLESEDILDQVSALSKSVIDYLIEEGPILKPLGFKDGYLFPLLLPPEIGEGWLYVSYPIQHNPQVESAMVKAMELLVSQTNSVLYNFIISQQAVDLEAFMSGGFNSSLSI